jgi:hypothetical protein
MSLNCHVQIKIYCELYHWIIYVVNEGRHVRIRFISPDKLVITYHICFVKVVKFLNMFHDQVFYFSLVFGVLQLW